MHTWLTKRDNRVGAVGEQQAGQGRARGGGGGGGGWCKQRGHNVLTGGQMYLGQYLNQITLNLNSILCYGGKQSSK